MDVGRGGDPGGARAQLAALSLTAGAYAAYLAARARDARCRRAARVRAGRARNRRQDAARIEAVFGGLAGEPLDVPVLQRKLGRQYGLDRYESVDYRLVRDDGALGLEIDMRRKSWGPNFLRLGVSVEQDFDGGATANAGAARADDRSSTATTPSGSPTCSSARSRASSPSSSSRCPSPATCSSRRACATSCRPCRSSRTAGASRAIASRESEAALAIGAELSNWGEVRVGLAAAATAAASVMIGDPGLPQRELRPRCGLPASSPTTGSTAPISRSTARRSALAWRGERESLGSSDDADIVEAAWLMARSHERYSVVFGHGGRLGARRSSWSRRSSCSRWAASSSCRACRADALAGTQYGLARAIAYRRVSRGGTGFFEFPAYLGVSLEAGNAWATRDDVDWSDLETGGSLFLGAESPFGPVYLAAGLGEGGRAGVLPAARPHVLSVRAGASAVE